MLPPSRTTGLPFHATGRSGIFRARAARSLTSASFFQSGYFAQPLNRKPAMATWPLRVSARTNTGPKSRVPPPSVWQQHSSTRPHHAAEYLLMTGHGHGHDHPEGMRQEGRAPERETGAALGRDLVPHPVAHRHVNAVRDGVGALDGLPRRALGGPVLRLLVGMPADRGGIEEDGRAAQRGQARPLGIPLVPADEGADAARLRVEG